MVEGTKQKLVKQGMLTSVETKLGDKINSIEMEGGILNVEPSDEYIEQCGSYEKADKNLETEVKKIIKDFTGKLGSRVSDEKNDKLMKKVKEELK